MNRCQFVSELRSKIKEEYGSISEAARKWNIHHNTIRQFIDGIIDEPNPAILEFMKFELRQEYSPRFQVENCFTVGDRPEL